MWRTVAPTGRTKPVFNRFGDFVACDFESQGGWNANRLRFATISNRRNIKPGLAYAFLPPALFSGGDVGIRTRVRKIHPANIYERSQSFSIARSSTSDRGVTRLSAGTQEPLFHPISGIVQVALQLSDARPFHRLEIGEGGRGPS